VFVILRHFHPKGKAGAYPNEPLRGLCSNGLLLVLQ